MDTLLPNVRNNDNKRKELYQRALIKPLKSRFILQIAVMNILHAKKLYLNIHLRPSPNINVQRHLFLQSINNTKKTKSRFLNRKVIFCDLEWPLRSYFILQKNCVFTMLAFIDFFLSKSVNERARKKKAKITESYSFLVRYRRTYVLNNTIISSCAPLMEF